MALKNVEHREDNTVVLTIGLDAKEFDKALEAVYRKNRNSIAIPGFRKGKAPRRLVEQMYGADIFYEDAVNDTYPKALEEAMEESGLDIVGYPKVEMQELGKEGYTFTAECTLRPVAVLGQYKGISVPRQSTEVTPEDVESELKPYVTRATQSLDVDRPAALGDTVNIDFEGFKDGEAFEGGQAEGYDLELGSGQFIPGFEDQLVGVSAGEDKDVNVTFPEDYGEKELAGAPVVFKVTVNKVKENQAPELDDEFAKDVSEFDTMEEFRDSLKEKIQKRKETNAQRAFEEELAQRLIDNSQIEIPDTMAQAEVDRQMDDFRQEVEANGYKFEEYLAYSGLNTQTFQSQIRPNVVRTLKLRAIYSAIADAEHIEVTPEDIEAQYQSMADEYDMDLEELKKNVAEKDITYDVRSRKAFELVRDTAVTEGEETPVEAEAPAEETPAAPEETAPEEAAPESAEAPAEEADGE